MSVTTQSINQNDLSRLTKMCLSNSLAIVTRCPGYLEGGVPALANPCLYISENSSLVGLQYACRQLGLPLHCIRLVPSNTTFGKWPGGRTYCFPLNEQWFVVNRRYWCHGYIGIAKVNCQRFGRESYPIVSDCRHRFIDVWLRGQYYETAGCVSG